MTKPALLFQASKLRILTGATVDLSVAGGSVHCVGGASGSGKTCLLRALADLDAAVGQVFLNGRERATWMPQDWRAAVMLVPAQPRWWLSSVQAHCAHDMSCEAAALELPADRLRAPTEQLSTGEQARGGLLRALSRDPRVLLLDEPTAALDAPIARAVEQLLLTWLSPSRAIIWISHDAGQVERVADHVWQLDHQGLRAT